MSVGVVLLSGGSQRNIHPGGCIGSLKLFLLLFYLYQWSSRVSPLDVPGRIFLSGSVKPYCVPQQFQVLVVWGLWCWTDLCQVLTEENY